MCKVFGVTGVNDKNRSGVIQLMKEMAPIMTKMEDDGIGYAGMDKQGNIFGERWLDVKKAFKRRPKKAEYDEKLNKPILDQFHDVVDYAESTSYSESENSYNSFGNVDMKKGVSFILHSRFSTGGNGSVNITNTHPFVKNGTAMIHNGIVYNEDEFKKEISTCDSEIILNQYEKHSVNMDSRNLGDALKNVDAYFACLLLTNTLVENGEMVPILDVFQNGASLKVIHVHPLNATFFVTNGPDLISLCKKRNWATSQSHSISENVLIRINAISGQVMEKQEFNYEVSYKYQSKSNWPSNNTSDHAINDVKSEAYLKSRYGEDWKNYEFRDGVDHDLDAPAYRNEPTLYDSTRFPYKEEMEEFRKQAKNNDDSLVTYIGNRKY
jgi:predicted glutamine amidotransferase